MRGVGAPVYTEEAHGQPAEEDDGLPRPRRRGAGVRRVPGAAPAGAAPAAPRGSRPVAGPARPAPCTGRSRGRPRSGHPAAQIVHRTECFGTGNERDPHSPPPSVPRRAGDRRVLPRGHPGDHQPVADERGRRPPPHRLRQRPLAGSVRQDRAGDSEGVPALAVARRRLRRARRTGRRRRRLLLRAGVPVFRRTRPARRGGALSCIRRRSYWVLCLSSRSSRTCSTTSS